MGGKTSEIPGFGWTKELRGEKFSSPVPVLFDFWVPLPPLLDFLFHSPLVSSQMLSLAGMGLLLLRGRGERGGLLSTLASHTHKPQSLFSSYSSPSPLSSKDSASSTLLLFSSPSSPNALSRFFSTKKERKRKFPPPTNFPAAIVSSRGGGP